jgi:hypothetical protein
MRILRLLPALLALMLAVAGAAPAGTVAQAATPSSTVAATLLWSADAGALTAVPAPDGSVWVLGVFTGGVTILDGADGRVVGHWGTHGSGPGQFDFKLPDEDGWWGGLAFGPNGSFAVAECGNARVELFDAHRVLMRGIGTRGTGNGHFLCPSGVAFGPNGDLFVSDIHADNIQRFASDGTFRQATGGFTGPAGINPDGHGNFVFGEVDGGGDAVVLAPDGTIVRRVGRPGQGPGRLGQVVEAVSDGAGNLFVADQTTPALSVFDSAGDFVGSIALDAIVPGTVVLDGVKSGGPGVFYVTAVIPTGAGPQDIRPLVVKIAVRLPSSAAPPTGSPSS